MGVDIMKYCADCQRNVQPSKKFSIGWFLVNCIWILGAPVYLLYFVFAKKKTCPICGGNHFETLRENIVTDGVVKNFKAPTVKSTTFKEKMLADRVVLKEKNVIAKEKFAAARQKVKDESAARALARQQKKLNKST